MCIFDSQDSGTVASFASKVCKGSCVPSQSKSSELSDPKLFDSSSLKKK